MADDMIDDGMTEEITEKNSTSVQNVSSAPPYISDFIGKNMDKLLEIYDEGLRENDEGLRENDEGLRENDEGALRMVCSQKENKMDVMFLNEENIQRMITKESWDDLKNSRGNKKLLICHDCDLNAIFLIFL